MPVDAARRDAPEHFCETLAHLTHLESIRHVRRIDEYPARWGIAA